MRNMVEQENHLDYLQRLLESKSTAKQITYKNLLVAFGLLMRESKQIAEALKEKVQSADEDVTVEFKSINEHEFHVKLAGDLLVFVLHTNVVTLPDAGTIHKRERSKSVFRSDYDL